jgi:predicted  nucleic acid-binding Zn-ribbon protein
MDVVRNAIFDEKRIEDLLAAIKQALTGEIDCRQLTVRIMDNLEALTKSIEELFPFILEQSSNDKVLAEFTENDPAITELRHELEERNTVLEKVGSRINEIYEKLTS